MKCRIGDLVAKEDEEHKQKPAGSLARLPQTAAAVALSDAPAVAPNPPPSAALSRASLSGAGEQPRAANSRWSGRIRRLRFEDIVGCIFVLVCVGYAIGFFLYPTYPTYDSYYSLVWGRELTHFTLPSFTEFRAPTEHPLAVFVGAALSLLGSHADRVWIALTLAAYLSSVWGLYQLGKKSFTPLVGAIAAALLLTRLDFAFLAGRGYIDVVFIALLIWAFVLETERRRRGVAVFLLLGAAGLLRPEAWLMAALYFCWTAWRASWRHRFIYAALAAIGPGVWAGLDLAVTGDPMFSLHHTSGLAETLGRQGSFGLLRFQLPVFLIKLIKLPVLLAGGIGLALASMLAPKRALMPLVLFATGIGTFLIIGTAGSSVIPRYLMVAALALLIFAAFALGGFTVLRPGSWLRRAWIGAALVLVTYGGFYTATHLSPGIIGAELAFRGDAHSSLQQALGSVALRDGRRCGPITVPNHKLVPDTRWILNLDRRGVIARADPHAAPLPAHGVGIYVASRFALFRQAFTDDSDPATIQIPPPNFKREFLTEHYAVYVSC